MGKRLVQRVGVALLLLLSFKAVSQRKLNPSERLLVKISPQHFFLGGLHIDIEKPLKNKESQSLVFSPRVYNGNTQFADAYTIRADESKEDNGKVWGVGGEFLHKINFLDYQDDYHRYYVSYGMNLQQFSIAFQKEGWIAETDLDGLTFFRFRNGTFKEKIARFGPVVYMGFQDYFAGDRFLFDIYLATGYYSSKNKTTYSEVRYNRNMLDYGFTGFYFYPGLKLGVAF